jgi:hypothetical protein
LKPRAARTSPAPTAADVLQVAARPPIRDGSGVMVAGRTAYDRHGRAPRGARGLKRIIRLDKLIAGA